jgi:peroxiredoxin Q/BCP
MRTILPIICAMGLFGFGAKAEPVAVGAEAPKVTAVDENGAVVDFAAIYAKQPTLVYFYPKADTPGCTAQACSLRDAFAELKAEGIAILGVSKDTPAAQKQFKEKHGLPFTLIADADGKVIEAFGVAGMTGLASRQSFIVKDGKIVWHSAKAKTTEHAQEVQAALSNLKNQQTAPPTAPPLSR